MKKIVCLLTMLLSFSAFSFSGKSSKKAAVPTAIQSWETSTNIETPESVYYDPESKTIFISNVAGAPDQKDGKGWITVTDKSGAKISAKWITGLNAPKGMRAYQGTLWVSDIDELLEINIKEAKIVKKYKIDGAKFLNDVAVDTKTGVVYVSDTAANKIYKVENGKVANLELPEGESWNSPNGLIVSDASLIVGSWGPFEKEGSWATKEYGDLIVYDLKSHKKTKTISAKLGNLDGVERLADGNYVVSDWMAGKVFFVDAESGKATEILSGFKGSADLGYIEDQNIIIVPRMDENKITAYKLN